MVFDSLSLRSPVSSLLLSDTPMERTYPTTLHAIEPVNTSCREMVQASTAISYLAEAGIFSCASLKLAGHYKVISSRCMLSFDTDLPFGLCSTVLGKTN